MWISTQIKYKASMDADEVQLSREAQYLNFKKSNILFASSEGSDETAPSHILPNFVCKQ